MIARALVHATISRGAEVGFDSAATPFIESAFVGVDQAWLDEEDAASDAADATVGGKAHAQAENIAFANSNNAAVDQMGFAGTVSQARRMRLAE